MCKELICALKEEPLLGFLLPQITREYPITEQLHRVKTNQIHSWSSINRKVYCNPWGIKTHPEWLLTCSTQTHTQARTVLVIKFCFFFLESHGAPRVKTHSSGLFKDIRIITMTSVKWTIASALLSGFPPTFPPTPGPPLALKFISSQSRKPRRDNVITCCQRSTVHCGIFLTHTLSPETHNDHQTGRKRWTHLSVLLRVGWGWISVRWILWPFPPPPQVNIMDFHRGTDTMLRLAVGVALVPIGALITLTADKENVGV